MTITLISQNIKGLVSNKYLKDKERAQSSCVFLEIYNMELIHSFIIQIERGQVPCPKQKRTVKSKHCLHRPKMNNNSSNLSVVPDIVDKVGLFERD